MMRDVSVADAAQVFDAERPRLVGLAYRMLGSLADADDVVQEAWLRWESTDRSAIESPPAWLTTVVTRLSIDQLRRRRREQERYVGPWLPEPLVEPYEEVPAVEPGPARQAELADSLTTAFLLLLEELSPRERAVVLLADVFDEPFDSVAEIVGTTPAAARQVASRARRRLRAVPPAAGAVPSPEQVAVARSFLAAALADDRDALLALLADDAVAVSDGGAAQHAARRPVVGPDRVARFTSNIVRRFAGVLDVAEVVVNGNPGVVARVGQQVVLVASVEVVDGRVQRLTSVLNPDKLRHVDDFVDLA